MNDFKVKLSNKLLPLGGRCENLTNFHEVGLVNEFIIHLPITQKLFGVRFPYEVLSAINSFDYLS